MPLTRKTVRDPEALSPREQEEAEMREELPLLEPVEAGPIEPGRHHASPGSGTAKQSGLETQS